MPTLTIVGALWGDEAKGKIVDALAGQADYVARYSGGANAGHTVVFHGEEFKFHLLPVGIVHPEVISVLGGGTVVCPKSLLEELGATRSRTPIGRLRISHTAHVVFPYHRRLDELEESARSSRIGTTSRGIGPAYTDKVQRIGIRMGEFVDRGVFHQRLREVLTFKNRLLVMFGDEPMNFDELFEEYSTYADALRPFVGDVETELLDAVDEGARIVFEGAQGTFLDLDHGTYPYVTSSHPTAAGAALGTGVGPLKMDQAWGVCKVYATRVGSGPFPTELDDEVGERIRQAGNEFGTTTGRPRRCGWLDLNLLRHSCRLNSLTGLVVTCADVLCGFESVRFCTGYLLEGQPMNRMPITLEEWDRVEPRYEELPGWDGDLRGAKRFEDLPANLKTALRRIEEFTGVPIAILSVGPDRSHTLAIEAGDWARSFA